MHPFVPDPARGTYLNGPTLQSELSSPMPGSFHCWRLIRKQNDTGTDSPSWKAASEGNWDEALHLLDTHRDAYQLEGVQKAALNIKMHWVRVVEDNLTAYTQWDLHNLALRETSGDDVRIVWERQVRQLEKKLGGPLPEMFNFGKATTYRLLHTEEGQQGGAMRYTGRYFTHRYIRAIRKLTASAPRLGEIYHRRIVPLPPPRPGYRLPGTRW